MRYFINQIKKKDCAFTSLKILLANIYKRDDFLYIPQSKDDRSYSLKEIIDEANKYGVVLKGYKTKDNDLNLLNKLPCLVNIKQDDMLHMVVVFKIKKNKVLIGDPASEIKYISKKEFLSKWSGEYLETEEILGSDYKILKVKSKINTFLYASLAIELVAFISLSLGLYCSNKDVNLLIPVLFFLVYGVLEILYRRLLIKGMKKFDEEICIPSYLESRNNLTNCLIDMNNYKKITFSSPINLFGTAFTLLFSTIILGLNNFINIINILVILTFNIAMFLISSTYLKSKKHSLTLLEDKLLYGKLKNDDFKDCLDELNKETYVIASLYDLKKFIGIFLSIGLSLIMLAINKSSGLNYILFHTFFYMFINNNIDKILKYSEEYNSYKKYKCLYLNYRGIN